ncbi:antibiotic biosynthesis monooxygenase family protein [Niallia sp. Krafla_26]|uniref:antibiotic biosynthesis monooxygenase family protein n=1 Tax=Niallia sp. Krafla_26 TaxID=3064703 RepID=UPI003D16AAFA
MNMYFTGGTEDYLKKIIEKHRNETLLLMQNEDIFLLAHETEGSSVFNEPKKYEIIDSSGSLTATTGFAGCNHIPVSDEGRPLFEYRFKNRARSIEKEPGFIAIRVLRPLRYDTYMVFTLWKDEKAYHQWKKSKSFSEAHAKGEFDKKQNPIIFPRPSFVTNYKIYEEKEEKNN